tara:strand:+ start:11605 stop:12384 length:780 start_codon:yes stop_codon:yes gene_type:complete
MIFIFKAFKNLILSKIINHLDKNRYSKNNHYGSSIEISLLYEQYKNELDHSQLFELTAAIYQQFILNDKKFVSPQIKSKDNIEKIWNLYMKRKTGEHYRLIPLISNLINSKQFLEIGTFRGASSKALLLNSNIKKIYTFDLIPWYEFKGSFLNKEDFKNGRIFQVIGDLSNKKIFKKNKNLLLESDFIFIDGPKNYTFEKIFLEKLFDLFKLEKKSVYILMDDVKLSTMAKLWRSIPYPKIILDVVGHWSGSGLIHVKN